MKTDKRILRFVIASVLLLLIVEIFYLSWLPNGQLGAETHLPFWLLAWSNHHFNLRTGIPFFVLSFLLQVWYSIGSWPRAQLKIPFWVLNITTATVLVGVVEGGQFFIAHRHPDGMDVVFGLLGSVLGCILHAIFNFITLIIFIKNEK